VNAQKSVELSREGAEGERNREVPQISVQEEVTRVLLALNDTWDQQGPLPLEEDHFQRQKLYYVPDSSDQHIRANAFAAPRRFHRLSEPSITFQTPTPLATYLNHPLPPHHSTSHRNNQPKRSSRERDRDRKPAKWRRGCSGWRLP
jgi:hypothetical protein